MKLRWTVIMLVGLGCLLGMGINNALGAEAAAGTAPAWVSMPLDWERAPCAASE